MPAFQILFLAACQVTGPERCDPIKGAWACAVERIDLRLTGSVERDARCDAASSVFRTQIGSDGKAAELRASCAIDSKDDTYLTVWASLALDPAVPAYEALALDRGFGPGSTGDLAGHVWLNLSDVEPSQWIGAAVSEGDAASQDYDAALVESLLRGACTLHASFDEDGRSTGTLGCGGLVPVEDNSFGDPELAGEGTTNLALAWEPR